MWNRLKYSLYDDVKILTQSSHNLIVLSALLIPVILIFILSKTGFRTDSYYQLIVISLVSVIPVISGITFASVSVDKIHGIQVNFPERLNALYVRMIICVFVSFVLLLVTTILSEPVPSQGWLRNLFAIFLLAIQAPFVFLIITSFSKSKTGRTVISVLCLVLLIAAPAGVMMHHPWNYFTFFSPLYWIIWTWIITSPAESRVYALIAIALTVGIMVLCIRHFLKKMEGRSV
jgi:hypothetical protein